jgi:Yip1 domain
MDHVPENAESSPEAPRPPLMSLPARLLNVFAVPGDVFDEVKIRPATFTNWLVPLLLLALTGAVSAIVIFSQPAIQQQLRERQAKVLEEQVSAGKLTQAQAEQARTVMEKFTGPALLMIFGGIGAVIASVARVFWWGLVLWLLGRWLLKVEIGYPKALEVAGLSLMIAVLGGIVGLLLVVNLGKLFAGPSLALVLRDFDETRKSDLFMGAANVFSFWLIGVLSVGLARLAVVRFIRAAWAVCTFWLLQELVLILIGLGRFAL